MFYFPNICVTIKEKRVSNGKYVSDRNHYQMNSFS